MKGIGNVANPLPSGLRRLDDFPPAVLPQGENKASVESVKSVPKIL
jgi:hypothetical protein